tara:strand:+ start:3234 stop:3383 length:150 start_codon:yes stop_codon:yes gene_type:complete
MNIEFDRFLHEKWLENCAEREAFNESIYTKEDYLKEHMQFLTELYNDEL